MCGPTTQKAALTQGTLQMSSPGLHGHMLITPAAGEARGRRRGITLKEASSRRCTLAKSRVAVRPRSRSLCSRCSSAASCELPVLAVAFSRTSSRVPEAVQL